MAWQRLSESWLARILVAVVAVAGAAGLRFALFGVHGVLLPYVTFYPAVILVALFGGLVPGLLATVLSAVAASLMWIWTDFEGVVFRNIDPHDHDVIGLAFFVTACVGISVSMEAMRRARLQAREASERARVAEERRRVAVVLERRDAQLRQFVEHSPAAVAMFDLHLQCLVASRRWREEFGANGDGPDGRAAREVFAGLPEAWKDAIRRGLAGATEVCESEPFPRPDGSLDWVRRETLPWGGEDGPVGGVMLFAEVVTDRKMAQDELERRVEDRTAELREAIASLRESHATLEKRTEQLGALALELTRAEQHERHRLAGILHDHVQQSLAAAKLHADLLRRHTGTAQCEAAATIHELVSESIEALRSLTVELSPPVLHEAGLFPALEWLARRMEEKHGLRVELKVEARTEPEPAELRMFLFDAVREMLFNVVKHAGVGKASVRIESVSGGAVRVAVEDGGAGFVPERGRVNVSLSGGFGLFSIRERIAHLGGRLEVESAPDLGSRFVLWAPCAPGAMVERRRANYSSNVRTIRPSEREAG